MWSRGPSARRRHHRHRHLVATAGNLWGLDAELNRSAQDKLPRAKFKLIEDQAGTDSERIWPRDRWGLDVKDIEAFCEIGDELASKDEARIDPAMERIYPLVAGRALRIVDEAFRRVPGAEMFAGDSGVVGVEPREVPPIGECLRIEVPIAVAGRSTGGVEAGADEPLERILRLADDRGSGPAVRAFVVLARDLGLQIRPYQWTLTITPPNMRAQALIALSPSSRDLGRVETWVAPAAFAAHFPNIAAERFAETLSGIRGVLLDAAQLQDIGKRLQSLLAHADSAGHRA